MRIIAEVLTINEKMKRKLIAMLALVGVLFATSCSKDDKEETMLSVSKKIVSFKSEGGETSIKVTSNSEWKAEGNSWIEIRKKDANLILSVKPNTTLNVLKGEVKVSAGNLEEVIKVTQLGVVGDATITPKSLELNEKEGEVTVKVVANIDSWTATVNQDWLKVTAKPKSDELLVKYEKNATANERKAVITVKIGKTEKTINVVQKAKEVEFILPYIDFTNYTFEEVDKFEKARGSKSEKGLEGNRVNYKPNNNFFHNIRYVFGKPQDLIMAITTPEKMNANKEGFKAFLASKGFKGAEENAFINENLGVRADILIMEEQKMAVVAFNKIKQKDDPNDKPDVGQGDAETFDELPRISVLPWGASEADVMAYEKANGGTFDESASKRGILEGNADRLAFKVNNNNDEKKPYVRIYMLGLKESKFKEGVLYKELQYKKVSLIYSIVKNKYVLSKKFKALTELEAFEYKGKDKNNFDSFESAVKKAVMRTGVGTFKGEKTPSAVIRYIRTDLARKQASLNSVDLDFRKSIEALRY